MLMSISCQSASGRRTPGAHSRRLRDRLLSCCQHWYSRRVSILKGPAHVNLMSFSAVSVIAREVSSHNTEQFSGLAKTRFSTVLGISHRILKGFVASPSRTERKRCSKQKQTRIAVAR